MYQLSCFELQESQMKLNPCLVSLTSCVVISCQLSVYAHADFKITQALEDIRQAGE